MGRQGRDRSRAGAQGNAAPAPCRSGYFLVAVVAVVVVVTFLATFCFTT